MIHYREATGILMLDRVHALKSSFEAELALPNPVGNEEYMW